VVVKRLYYDLTGRNLPFAEVYHGIKESQSFCSHQIIYRYVGFLYGATVKKTSTLRACQQRMLRREPACTVVDGYVGKGGVGDETVLYDYNLVAATFFLHQSI